MLITRCIACGTRFRLTLEQLDARGGRVRCGACRSVFDARESLRLADDEPAPQQNAPAELRREDDPAPADTSPLQGPDDAPDAPGEPVDAQPADEPEPASPPDEHVFFEPPESVESGPAAAATASGFDFGPAPERRRRTGLWATGCLLLVLVLAGQALFHWRGTIALLLPESKPYLDQTCAALGCSLPLPRKSELMSIESSDLQGHPNNPAVMVLIATLRNRAPFAQDFPALELTLTDDREKSLARRVLQPADYLGLEVGTGEGFAGNSERPVRVFIEASELKATGYRLYLFYP